MTFEEAAGLGMRENLQLALVEEHTATPAAAIHQPAAQGVTINVTLMFTARQHRAASEAIWRGARRRSDGLDSFKSVYSIFISRVDVYTAKRLPHLSPATPSASGVD